MSLVHGLDEQRVLENVLDESKPLVPAPCKHMHPLLAAPFRYAPYPHGSRFRRARQRDGAFYASRVVETAVAETPFYALLFYRESPETTLPRRPVEKTAFMATVRTERSLDLCLPPLADMRRTWTTPVDYTLCQDLADSARAAEVQAIAYESVRDPSHRQNVALFDCRCFAMPAPSMTESRHLFVRPDGVDARREFPDLALAFPRQAFAGDPRLSG